MIYQNCSLKGGPSELRSVKKRLVARLAGRFHPTETVGYPEELLERKYMVSRDEMLWREYSRWLSRGDRDGMNKALRILRVIREAPD